MEFEGRTAVITGAASGIGKATAAHLAHEGARVMLVDRDETSLQATAEELRQKGGSVQTAVGDIREERDMQRVFNTVETVWGRLDVLFAHAGINGVWAPVEELTLEEWTETIQVNLTGTFLTVKYAIPLLKRQGGAIIITSSVTGTRMFSTGGRSAYASSKAGQFAFAKMMALELAPHQIRVNVICPGSIDTPLNQDIETRNLDEAGYDIDPPAGGIPLTGGRAGSPEHVAALVGFLASDRAAHITGTPIWIDGGQSLLLG